MQSTTSAATASLSLSSTDDTQPPDCSSKCRTLRRLDEVKAAPGCRHLDPRSRLPHRHNACSPHRAQHCRHQADASGRLQLRIRITACRHLTPVPKGPRKQTPIPSLFPRQDHSHRDQHLSTPRHTTIVPASALDHPIRPQGRTKVLDRVCLDFPGRDLRLRRTSARDRTAIDLSRLMEGGMAAHMAVRGSITPDLALQSFATSDDRRRVGRVRVLRSTTCWDNVLQRLSCELCISENERSGLWT